MPAKYRKWKEDFCFHAKLQALDDIFDGNFAISMQVWTTTSRLRSDMDNSLASVLDALQDCGIIANDKKNRSGHYFLHDKKNETNEMKIVITEMSDDQYPAKPTKKKTKK